MNTPMADLLALHAMGLLDEEETTIVQEHLRAHPEDLEEVAANGDTFHQLALDEEPVEPSANLLEGILAATETVSRFDDFVSTIAKLIGDTVERARALVSSLDEAGSWEPGPSPHSILVHFEPGPALAAGTLTGFVKVDAGAPFPEHTHIGKEAVYVIQGGLKDSDGTVVTRGQLREMDDGTTHDFVALDGPDLIYLVVLEKGGKFDFEFEI